MCYPLASRNTGRRASHSRENGMLQLRQCRSERCRMSINPVMYACLAPGHFDQGSPLRKCRGFVFLALGLGSHCSGSCLHIRPRLHCWRVIHQSSPRPNWGLFRCYLGTIYTASIHRVSKETKSLGKALYTDYLMSKRTC